MCLQGGGKESGPQHMEHTCVDQGRKIGYQPPPFDQTPCHLNQKNCTKVCVCNISHLTSHHI